MYDDPVIKPCCAGSRTSSVNELIYKDGKPIIRTVKKIDNFQMINSYADSCDMSVILNKLASGIIPSGFDETDCADIADIPNNFADAINVVKKGKEIIDEYSTLVDNYVDNSDDKSTDTTDTPTDTQEVIANEE